jgi:hypothetical protein
MAQTWPLDEKGYISIWEANLQTLDLMLLQ